MPKKTIKTFCQGQQSICSDEIYVEILTALGCVQINGIMPLKMKSGLINAYKESGAIKGNYLYINGQEITN